MNSNKQAPMKNPQLSNSRATTTTILLMPISCHLRDCKVLLDTTLTHVSSTWAGTGPLPLHLLLLQLLLHGFIGRHRYSGSQLGLTVPSLQISYNIDIDTINWLNSISLVGDQVCDKLRAEKKVWDLSQTPLRLVGDLLKTWQEIKKVWKLLDLVGPPPTSFRLSCRRLVCLLLPKTAQNLVGDLVKMKAK